jgi:hypothetical protein
LLQFEKKKKENRQVFSVHLKEVELVGNMKTERALLCKGVDVSNI